MLDLPMDLLPLANAITIDLEWIGGIIIAVLGSVGGGLKLVWNYWTTREQKRIDRYKEILDAKDATIAAKDAQIVELGKELSRKSDEHAAKVQELMNLTLTKVEEWSTKQEAILDRALTVQAEFTEQVRKITRERGS